MKRTLGNIVLIIVSLGIALVVGEFGIRLFLKPIDFLSVTLTYDPALGWRISPFATGHDAWGFRNPNVPQSADIVALGDSHTYGNRAKMSEAWPSVLQRLISKRVYNLGVGGYGPNQYYYLLQGKALKLSPKIVLVGLYLGDDLDNAYTITYGLDYWNYLRSSTTKGPVPYARVLNTSGAGKKVREWLSRHSVIYQIVVHGPVLGWLKESLQTAQARRTNGGDVILIVPEKNISEAFLPAPVLYGVDLKSESTREGLRITLKLIEEMSTLCKERSIRFVIVLIPTKEFVFSKYLKHNKDVKLKDVVDEVISDTQIVRNTLLESFSRSGIECVDTTKALQESIDWQKLYTASTTDMHPNRNGYRVIAECVAQYLSQSLP